LKTTLLSALLIWAVASVENSTLANADDSHPASSNISGQQYPRIDSDSRATFQVKAPMAQKVQVSVGATYDLTKGDDGMWLATTRPLAPGFHYYWILIDGVKVDDPASETFFWRKPDERRD
jgi:1,4-alpha-glucan branching enzyme